MPRGEATSDDDVRKGDGGEFRALVGVTRRPHGQAQRRKKSQNRSKCMHEADQAHEIVTILGHVTGRKY